MRGGRGRSRILSRSPIAWAFLFLAAPACASDVGLPPRWSVEAGWWKNRPGSEYERHWSSGPVVGVSAEFLRRARRSGFARIEYASIAADVGELQSYYGSTTAESDGRASVAMLSVGLHGRPGGFGEGGLGRGALARLSSNFEISLGFAKVKEPAFHYTYTSAVPPASYTISADSHLRPVLGAGFGLEWGAVSRIPMYLDARAGLTAFHDPVMPLSVRLGTRIR